MAFCTIALYHAMFNAMHARAFSNSAIMNDTFMIAAFLAQ